MLVAIHKRLGIPLDDPVAEEMRRTTPLSELADQMEEFELAVDQHAARGPNSAVDTNA